MGKRKPWSLDKTDKQTQKELADLRRRIPDRNSVLYFVEFNQIMDRWELKKKQRGR